MTNRFVRALSVSIVVFAATTFVSDPIRADNAASMKVMAGGIHLDMNMIPKRPEGLPVLKLSRQKLPFAYLRSLLDATSPNATSIAPPVEGVAPYKTKTRALTRLLVSYVGKRVVAYADPTSGRFEIVPLLDRLRPAQISAERASSIARAVLSRPDVIAKDDTRVEIQEAQPLLGATYLRGKAGEAGVEQGRGTYLEYVSLRRFVGDVPVYGPGSRTSVAVGADGIVRGLVRNWKAATTAGRVSESRSPEAIAAAIRAQLTGNSGADIIVTDVKLAYYDGNNAFMQPVYRFTARIHFNPASAAAAHKGRHVDDDFVIGYVPIGEPREVIPSLNAPQNSTPAMPSGKGVPPIHDPRDPTVGRYIVRNDNPNWVADANEFWAGLTSVWWLAGNFTNSQYYWAYPYEYTASKNYFVNSVNVAMTQSHGDWWLFSTLSNCCDLVDVTTIPGGYGNVAGGRTRYWVIHSCEVVPGPDDTSSWASPWWHMFQGLHTVVGYRTIMYIDDDVGFPFGWDVAVGVPVVSAWLTAVSADPAYFGRPTATAHGGVVRPMGRASTVSACGREGDTIYNTAAVPAASCLRIFWYPD